MTAISARSARTGETEAQVITAALADALELDRATLFQVATSDALAAGVYQGAVSVGVLEQHGDFGLGTFDGLDGELVALDGEFFRVDGSGAVSRPGPEVLVPFAVVTDFRATDPVEIGPVTSFDDLTVRLDDRRDAGNLFFAVRIDGRFARVKTRALGRVADGTSLRDASMTQAEFEFTDVVGTIVGFWTPSYARTINVPGWHLHFMTADRQGGGHVLDCAGTGLQAQLDHVSEVRIAIPETAAFLRADLSQDRSADLEVAERDHVMPETPR